MRSGIHKNGLLSIFLFLATTASAQSGGGSTNYFIISLAIIAVLILIAVVLQVADNLLKIEARQMGVSRSGANYSIFPRLNEIFRPKMPAYATGQPTMVLQKGHDILLEGAANGVMTDDSGVKTYGIQPPNFIGLSPIPKLMVEIGDEVKAGDELFFDKKRPEVKFVAPVSGEVIAVKRGDKRSIASVVILADKEMKYREFEAFDLLNGSREELVNYLMETGAWTLLRQRPFDVLPAASDIPKNIFISTFDTAPLAPDLDKAVQGREEAFQKGLDVLARLTPGMVHLGLSANRQSAPSSAFMEAEGVEKTYFQGKHPSGNVGVQIHHVSPINANEKVWTLGVQEVITMGQLFLTQQFDASRLVAVTGAELTTPKYIRTYIGANIGELTKDNLENDNIRFISGDVLSGKAKSAESFLNYYDDQVTVVEEGDFYELFGWLVPIAPRPTVSRTFPNFLYPDLKFKANTNTHGEQRAFVVTGQYEQVLPMDIFPQHLMKAILIKDFERMEGLGIYELIEEDVALCEFVCTSKQPLQAILRDGLDTMREQG